MSIQYWLFKSEPGAYSFSDLLNDGVAEWDGVRNYQARTILRDKMKVGDEVLFYHSNTTSPSVVDMPSFVPTTVKLSKIKFVVLLCKYE